MIAGESHNSYPVRSEFERNPHLWRKSYDIIFLESP